MATRVYSTINGQFSNWDIQVITNLLSTQEISDKAGGIRLYVLCAS